MARKRKKIQSKYLTTAAGLRKDRKKQLIISLIALAVALIILGVYFFLVSNSFIQLGQVSSLLVWVFFAVEAAIVGLYSNRFSRANTEYKKYIREYEIPDEEVKRFMKERGL